MQNQLLDILLKHFGRDTGDFLSLMEPKYKWWPLVLDMNLAFRELLIVCIVLSGKALVLVVSNQVYLAKLLAVDESLLRRVVLDGGTLSYLFFNR